MKKKNLKITLVALTLLLALSACSPKSSSDYMSYPGSANQKEIMETTMVPSTTAPAMNYYTEDAAGGASSTGASKDGGELVMGETPVIDTSRKLIRTGNYRMETTNYPQTILDIEQLVNTHGGYVQDSSESGSGAFAGQYNARYASYTFRVPVENFFAFCKDLSNVGIVYNANQSTQEVTDYYFDTDARLKTLRIQEERLLALMSQATQLEAIISLESSLGEVRYQIESYEGTLRRLDGQVAMSTVNVDIQEVFEPTKINPVPVTLGEKISRRFSDTIEYIKDGLESFLVFIIGDGLLILIFAAVALAVFFIIRNIVKKVKTRRRNAPPAKEQTIIPEEDSKE